MKPIQFLPVVALMACTHDSGILTKVASLPLEEVSGIEHTVTGLWALEDSGNANKIYKLGTDGKITNEVTIANTDNNDWEDITSDAEGNLYIGDFGNNDNDRKDLAIYKVVLTSLTGKTAEASATVTFDYPEQTEFPPKKQGRIFDVEAFYEHNGSFYLFTKNRSSKFNGDLSVYMIPNKAGHHHAKLIGTLNTCSMYKKCAVTAADISPDGKTVVLLAGDRLWMITGFTEGSFNGAARQEYQLGHDTQKEGICYLNENTLLITDEKDKKDGGFLYEVKVADLKAKP